MKTFTQFVALLAIIAVVGAVLSFMMSRRTPPKGPSLRTPAPDSTQVVTIRENASSTPSIDVRYPQFPSLSADLSRSIESAVETRLAEFRTVAEGNIRAGVRPHDLSFAADWKPAQVSSRYVSFVIYFDSYEGGASGRQEMETFNYDVKEGKLLALSDLFTDKTGYLERVSREARAELLKKFKAMGGSDEASGQLEAGTEPKADNFRYFTFTDKELNLYFPKYAVGPGAFGAQEISIPRSSLR